MADNVIESENPKRKRAAELPTQNQLQDSSTEVQVGSSKRKRVQEDLIIAPNNMTEAESTSSKKKNSKRNKRKRLEEGTGDNNHLSASMLTDEVTQSTPKRRKYKAKKPANKGKKADEQTPADISNDRTSATTTVEQSSETIQAVQDDGPSSSSAKSKRPTKKVKKSVKSNETVSDATNINDSSTTASKRVSKRTSTKNKVKNTSQPKAPTQTKLRHIMPKKTSETANVSNAEEKSESSTFPVVLNKPKNDATNTLEHNDHIDDTDTNTNDVTTTLTHADVSDVGSASLDRSSNQSNVNKIENKFEKIPHKDNENTFDQSFNKDNENTFGQSSNKDNENTFGQSSNKDNENTLDQSSNKDNVIDVENNEESSSNTRSGGVIGISNLLNPIEDSPKSTSTIYDNYFSNNNNLYQASSTPTNNHGNNIISNNNQNTGYGSTTPMNANNITTPFQRNIWTDSSTVRVPLSTRDVNESGTSTFPTVVSQGFSGAYSNSLNQGNATTYTRTFGQNSTSTYVSSSYTQDSPIFFENSYSSGNKSRNSITFANSTESVPVSTTSTSKFDVLISAANFVESKSPEALIQDEARKEFNSAFYNGSERIYTSSANSAAVLTGEVVTPYRTESGFLSYAGPSTFASTNTSAITQGNNASSELLKENETRSMEASPAQEDTNEVQEEQVSEQNVTKPRRRRVTTVVKKKAGRKPKAKLTEEEEAAQFRAPIPQPNCTICKLVVPPASDQPSATYITPQRARESMLLKGRDKVNRMVRCGYCSKWYHLACMYPPRRTMPTGGYVWRCAECDHPSSSTSESPAEPAEPVGHSGGLPTIPTKKWNLRSARK